MQISAIATSTLKKLILIALLKKKKFIPKFPVTLILKFDSFFL